MKLQRRWIMMKKNIKSMIEQSVEAAPFKAKTLFEKAAAAEKNGR